MANQNHFRILHEGQYFWNNWRKQEAMIPDLREADLAYEDLAGYDLSKAQLVAANLEGANLCSAKLNGANLSLANLTLADLSHANLQEATLFMARLFGSKFAGADLRKAVLVATSIVNSNLSGLNLEGASMATSSFGNLDLSEVRGLSEVIHWGPSTIGIDTLYRSRGRIPVPFLRGAGVPESFIDYALSLTQDALTFSSCFISYSSRDEDFAAKLWADLQDQGIRCWFAPADLRVGASLRTSIDEAIHLHDRLVIILSRNSISSPWVEKEVETAFEKERSFRRPVLFPLRLDDYIFETKAAWAADLRRMRHIGDFRQWKDKRFYHSAFQRLLRDLEESVKGGAPNPAPAPDC